MARDTVDSTPIETVADLAATLEEGCKPEEKFLICRTTPTGPSVMYTPVLLAGMA